MTELNQARKDAFVGKMVGILNGAALALMMNEHRPSDGAVRGRFGWHLPPLQRGTEPASGGREVDSSAPAVLSLEAVG
jgi:hypothetical protein